jgi:hypothetical protein
VSGRVPLSARQSAEESAPAPQASALAYGLIALSLFAVACWGISEFYRFKLAPYPIVLGCLGIIAFAYGAWLRRRRKRQHSQAYDAEIRRQAGQNLAGSVASDPALPEIAKVGEIDLMSERTLSAGDRVTLISDFGNQPRPGWFEVVRTIPSPDGPIEEYRVRGPDGRECVVHEREVVDVAAAKPTL